MKSYLKQYIDGAWVDSDGGRIHQVIDPSTEQPCTEIMLGTAADVDKAVAAARAAFESWSQTSVQERLDVLGRIMTEYKARMPDLAKAMSQEMGAPMALASMAQARPASRISPRPPRRWRRSNSPKSSARRPSCTNRSASSR